MRIGSSSCLANIRNPQSAIRQPPSTPDRLTCRRLVHRCLFPLDWCGCGVVCTNWSLFAQEEWVWLEWWERGSGRGSSWHLTMTECMLQGSGIRDFTLCIRIYAYIYAHIHVCIYIWSTWKQRLLTYNRRKPLLHANCASTALEIFQEGGELNMYSYIRQIGLYIYIYV